jgi:signal transduction histidine kinase
MTSDDLFSSDVWQTAMEKYAIAANLTVKLFDAEERVVFGAIHTTPMFQLFEERGYDPGIFAECVRRCLAQIQKRPVVIVSQLHGLTVVGTSLVLEDKVVGAVVGGYAFVDFFQLADIQRLARQTSIRFDRLWHVARHQKPVPQTRLTVLGELLQVLGDALLAEAAAREQEQRLQKAEKIAAAGQLAASMAHEINNPLSSVTNALFLIKQDSSLNELARSLVTTAATELARVSRIVKQSLSYYHVETIPHELDLSNIVKESLQIFSDKLQRAGIELNSRLHDGTSLVGFPDEIRQVIDNLLVNSLEAMPHGGRLSIAVHESCDWRHRSVKGVRLTIGDSGCGIPKQNHSRIFEPFFTTKFEKGTGLGMWVLQGIISKHEGSMKIRSSDAKERSGTVVSVFLPSRPPDSSKAARPEWAA